MSARPRAQHAETRLVPLDILVARARAGGYGDLCAAIGALRKVAARRGVVLDYVDDALADALEELLEARE